MALSYCLVFISPCRSPLNISCRTSKVSDEKPAMLIGALYVMSCFSWWFQVLFTFRKFDYVSGGSLCLFYLELEASWMFMELHSFTLGHFQPLFLQIFSLPFSLPLSLLLRLPQCICCSSSWCSTGHSGSVHFSSICFSCSSLVLSLSSPILLCAQRLPLNPFSEFFISVIVLFNSIIFVFLGFLFIDIYILFRHHLLDFLHILSSLMSLVSSIAW